MMKILATSVAVALVSSTAFAYQVTGPVTAVNKDSLIIQKGKEKWEIARGKATIPSDVVVGSKVTVEYTMTASEIVNKDAPKAAPAKDAKAAEKPAKDEKAAKEAKPAKDAKAAKTPEAAAAH